MSAKFSSRAFLLAAQFFSEMEWRADTMGPGGRRHAKSAPATADPWYY